jgi:putative NADPH-quinone reductase
MSGDRALVVVADRASCGVAAEATARSLSGGYEVATIDLAAAGFGERMSEEEWRAYHSPEPILDPLVADHARLVAEAAALVFVYPSVLWGPPPVIKAWLERVLVPGVAFTFDARHHVRPNLVELRVLAGVTWCERPPPRSVGDGGRRMILRAVRLNAPQRVRTAWVTGTDPADPELAARIATGLARL